MSLTKKTGVAVLAASTALALPGAALADPGHGGRGGERGGDVPTRVASKLRSAERALDRAEERAEDGNVDGATSSLAAVRRRLASGTKSALKRIVAGNETGVPSAHAVASTDHRLVGGTVGLLDGAGDALVTASTDTLDAALDSRDQVVAAIAALGEDDRDEYDRVLDEIADDATDEAEDINEALTDDELTDDAKAQLNEALTQLSATATAAKAAAGSADSADYPGSENVDYASDDDDRGDCPRGGNGHRRGDRSENGSTGSGTTSDQAGTYPGQV